MKLNTLWFEFFMSSIFKSFCYFTFSISLKLFFVMEPLWKLTCIFTEPYRWCILSNISITNKASMKEDCTIMNSRRLRRWYNDITFIGNVLIGFKIIIKTFTKRNKNSRFLRDFLLCFDSFADHGRLNTFRWLDLFCLNLYLFHFLRTKNYFHL